jgi:hypothetical protein
MSFSTHGLRARFSAHGAPPEGNLIDGQDGADMKKIVLGDNLSPRVGLFRGASVKTVGQLDISQSGVAPLLPEDAMGSFMYDLSGIPTFLEPRKLQLQYGQVGGIKPICNGSNSHISKAEFEGQKLILKVVQLGKATNAKALQEFQREIAVMCRLCHPNITTLIGAGYKTESHQAMPFILLERLDGGTLTAKLHNNKKAFGKPFSFPQYLSYCKQFADALAYMHTGWLPDATIIHRGACWWKGAGVVPVVLPHAQSLPPSLESPSLLLRSDLKPDNIGFSADGTLKLLDFGLCVCVRRRSSSTDAYKMTGTYVRTRTVVGLGGTRGGDALPPHLSWCPLSVPVALVATQAARAPSATWRWKWRRASRTTSSSISTVSASSRTKCTWATRHSAA